MKRSLQQPLPPMPLERVDTRAKDDLHKVESEAKPLLDAVEMPLDEARAAIGRVVARVISRSESALKEFGDKSQVARWGQGKENPNLARLWQRPHVRRELVIAIAEESGVADVQTTVVVKRTA